MFTLLAALLLCAPENIPEIAPLRVDVEGTEARLQDQPDLLRHHAGYLRYLEAHPEIAAAEQDWWELNALGRFAPLARDFDNALASDPDAAALFDTFYGNFAQGGGANWTDRLQELGENEEFRKDTLRAGMDYLRAHPESLLPLLRNDYAGISMPEVMKPMQDYLRQNPQALEAVRNVLRSILADNPKAQEMLQFWSGEGQVAPSGVTAFAAMADYFRLHPAHFWNWHQRNLLLAADPQAAAWIRWWHQQVREDKALGNAYFPYLAKLGRQYGIRGLLERSKAAEIAPWPPAGPPAALQREPQLKKSAPTAPPAFERPERPRFERPAKPERPERPGIQMRPPRPARERR